MHLVRLLQPSRHSNSEVHSPAIIIPYEVRCPWRSFHKRSPYTTPGWDLTSLPLRTIIISMKPITITVPRYEPMQAWANRILRVDLGQMRVTAQETAPYVPAYLGGRGIAARIAWDEYPAPVDPFDPANPLMVFTGALTGSRAPYAGRTNVCAFSPQAYPHPWFTRSSIGGRFGGELKRAGYDGIVITGAAESPVRVRVRDDQVSILPACPTTSHPVSRPPSNFVFFYT